MSAFNIYGNSMVAYENQYFDNGKLTVNGYLGLYSLFLLKQS